MKLKTRIDHYNHRVFCTDVDTGAKTVTPFRSLSLALSEADKLASYGHEVCLVHKGHSPEDAVVCAH